MDRQAAWIVVLNCVPVTAYQTARMLSPNLLSPLWWRDPWPSCSAVVGENQRGEVTER